MLTGVILILLGKLGDRMGAVLGYVRLLITGLFPQDSNSTDSVSDSDSASVRSARSRSSRRSRVSSHRNNSTFLNTSSRQTHRKERIPDVFTGSGAKGDLKDWLCHFETCSKWNGWDYTEKGVNLAMSLRGNAQQVLGELSVFELEDFDALREALERRFDPAEKENLHRVEFRCRMKKKEESVTEFGFALNRIATNAYPKMPQEARETIVIDQFIGGLPSKDLRRHVQFHHPNTIHQAIALASEFESFDERFDGRKPENKDQSVRSISGESSQQQEMLKAFQALSSQVTSSLEKVTKRLETVTNGGGDKQKSSTVVCYACGERGHYSKNCRQRGDQGNGNRDRGYVNTGNQGRNKNNTGNDQGARP